MRVEDLKKLFSMYFSQKMNTGLLHFEFACRNNLPQSLSYPTCSNRVIRMFLIMHSFLQQHQQLVRFVGRVCQQSQLTPGFDSV